MKKIVSLTAVLLFVTIVFGILQVSAATDSVEVTIGQATLNKAQGTSTGYYIVQVPVKITENTGFMSIKLNIDYNDELELIGWTEGDVFPYVAGDEGVSGTDDLPASGKVSAHNGTSSAAEDLKKNPFVIYYISALQPDNTATGTLMTLKFKVPEDVAVGEYEISATVVEACSQKGNVGATAGTELPADITEFCTTVAGGLEVIEDASNVIKYGDVNSDGKVDRKDLSRLAQYFARWSVEIDKATADVNGDGKVDRKDLTRLAQYFARWDVQLGK